MNNSENVVNPELYALLDKKNKEIFLRTYCANCCTQLKELDSNSTGGKLCNNCPLLKDNEYCDCDERCKKCGKKKRVNQLNPLFPYPQIGDYKVTCEHLHKHIII